MLPRSADGVLVTLTQIASPGTPWPRPVARSYDGHAWELVHPQAGLAQPMPLACSGMPAACAATIPSDNSTYSIDIHPSAAALNKTHLHLARQKLAARFLIQTTWVTAAPGSRAI